MSEATMSETALMISSFALSFTIFSFWWMNWRKGSLLVSSVRTYAAGKLGNKLFVRLPLIFFNPGALPVLVENLRLTFLNIDNTRSFLFFNATVEKLKPDEKIKNDLATPFAVHKGQALLQICEFVQMPSSFKFELKNYDFILEAQVGGETDWKEIKTFQLKIRPSQVHDLNTAFIIHDNDPQLNQQ
ncbi:hypothetical protein [Desulfobulbus sp.]|uniref:hypothetical protein n=1 Tax=Desulfobulbus sp. TaxID=895 RepID=UPI0027BAC5CF|nr:hypothetical protein [Desulfobulbus sp.]